MALSRGHKLTIIAAILLVIDQVSKILVKTNMTIGESISVFGDWFQILFIENPGMAFGMEFGGSIGKYILTILRIVLVVVMFIYLRRLLKKDAQVPMGVCVGIMMVMVGALGNIIDCMFYGILFGESTMMQIGGFLPEGGGYAPFFLGKVVDMLYFPLIDTTWPDWVPWVGGESLVFFRPIFNFADSCITVGAFYLLIFHYKFFSEK
jgi:signal peptidase II